MAMRVGRARLALSCSAEPGFPLSASRHNVDGFAFNGPAVSPTLVAARYKRCLTTRSLAHRAPPKNPLSARTAQSVRAVWIWLK